MIILLINDYILQTDYTSGHATIIQSPKTHQIFNAKLSRAISFATNGQVEYSEKYCYYTVVDENRKPWIVNMNPTPKCSCNERFGCVHIYAVQRHQGKNIESLYKIAKLTPLTGVIRTKNNGTSGRKRKGQNLILMKIQLNQASQKNA